jgi:hypothetical protein
MELYNKLIKQSRVQIAQGGLEKALHSLLFVAKTFELPKAYDHLALISGSYHSLEVYHSSGTIDPDFAALQRSRIQQKLVRLADEMEAELRGKKFEIEVKIAGPVDKKVSDWVQSLFL